MRVVLSLGIAGALAGSAIGGPTFNQGFETDTAFWFDGGSYGTLNRVASGSSGIPSASGSWHAEATGSNSAPYTTFGGYQSSFGGGFVARLDVYLDTAMATGSGFDYSVAASRQNGNHLRDFVFHVTKDTSTGKLLVGASNNTNFAPRQDLENINHAEVTQTGWYTLEHVFYDNGGVLAVDLNLIGAGNTVLFTETRSDAGDLIASVVGGNRYGWLTFISSGTTLSIDNTTLEYAVIPLPSAAAMGLCGLALVAMRRSR